LIADYAEGGRPLVLQEGLQFFSVNSFGTTVQTLRQSRSGSHEQRDFGEALRVFFKELR
jgi:hypothetical protein